LKFRLLVFAVLAVAVAAPAAFGWSQTYESNVVWGAGSTKISYANSITYNYVSFDKINGGLPQMGTRLCNSSGLNCNDWRWSNNGLITDERGIAYGVAACKANDGNNYLVYVRYCATGNG
jgi:hypothetical protein